MRKQPPTRTLRPPSLTVDPAKYPGLEANPALERALRIRQALGKGKPRDEAVQLAEQAMGRRAPAIAGRHAKPVPAPAGARAKRARGGGKAPRPKRRR